MQDEHNSPALQRWSGRRLDSGVLVTVLGEIPHKPQALREIFGALKPVGILSVTEVLPDLDYQDRRTVLGSGRHRREGMGEFTGSRHRAQKVS